MTKTKSKSKTKSMSKTKVPRTGGGARTRARILSAAKSQFARRTYETVGLRDIARKAKVDVALVARYFGSKEKLYKEVLNGYSVADSLMTGDRATFGKRMAAWLLEDGFGGRLDSLFFILRATTSPRTLALFRKSDYKFATGPFAEWLGGEHRQLRAHLIASTMFGATTTRLISRDIFSSKAERTEYASRIAALLQAYVDDRWISEKD
jgi:AcrR family transcriptional regulator